MQSVILRERSDRRIPWSVRNEGNVEINMENNEVNMTEKSMENTEVSARDQKYMQEALELAKQAAEGGDVPIGCVIVHGDEVIGRGYNRRNQDHSVLAHAELLAIGEATEKLSDWRIEECTLYVTLEPCQMCAGAIIQARIPRVVIGSMNPKAGCAGSIFNLLEEERFNHQAEVVRGVLAEESSRLLKNFFARLRMEKGTTGNKEIL